jgi:hypothetical protein
MASSYTATDAQAYKRLMGRWSMRLAEELIGFAGIASGERLLDVGCGTGSMALALAARPEPAAIVGIDIAAPYLAYGILLAAWFTSGSSGTPPPHSIPRPISQGAGTSRRGLRDRANSRPLSARRACAMPRRLRSPSAWSTPIFTIIGSRSRTLRDRSETMSSGSHRNGSRHSLQRCGALILSAVLMGLDAWLQPHGRRAATFPDHVNR